MAETTYRYIMDHCNWDKACDVMGWNSWMFAEGLCNDEATVVLSLKQAEKIGLTLRIGL